MLIWQELLLLNIKGRDVMFNVIRKQPAPASLSDKTSYASKDVIDALYDIFSSKCYICEKKYPLNVNVEHRISHQNDDDKKFCWDNLYLVCGRCNNIKLSSYDDVLDCCDVNVDVLRAIKHKPPVSPFASSVEITAQFGDDSTASTAELLNKAYNSTHTHNKSVTAVAPRREIFKKFNVFMTHQNIFFDEDSLPDEKRNALERIKLLIKPSSEFSAFISWCVLDDTELCPLLEEFIGMRE